MNTSIFSKALVLTAAMLAAGQAAAASDWTATAYHACTTQLGNTSGTGGGLKAVGGTAVVSCPVTKKQGTNNLNFFYARMKRANGGGANPFCTLTSYNNYNTASNSKYGYASSGAGNKSIWIAKPTTYSTGYMGLICVLNANDVLFGYRYGQD